MTPQLDSNTLYEGSLHLPDMVNASLIRYLELIAKNVCDSHFLLHGTVLVEWDDLKFGGLATQRDLL